MVRLAITSRAEADIWEVGAHIAVDDPAAADRWLDQVFAEIELLRAFPEKGRLFPRLLPECRRLVVGNYLVFYSLADECVTVIRVLHGARDWGSGDLTEL